MCFYRTKSDILLCAIARFSQGNKNTLRTFQPQKGKKIKNSEPQTKFAGSYKKKRVYFIFQIRYNLFLFSVNSLSGISHLSVDTLILIFPPQTPSVDYHEIQPLSVYQTFEKIMKAMKKHWKFMLFYVDTSTVDKGFLWLFHPSTNFSNHPSFL